MRWLDGITNSMDVGIIVSGGWEGRLEGGLMMIREKWGLVMPLSAGQSRGIRHETIFVWDSGL